LEKNKGQRRGNTETLLLPGFFELFRMPDGSAIVRPKELANEVSVRQACELLKLSKSTVNWLCDMGHLEWRWSTPMQGKRLIKVASICSFRDARSVVA
jgi:hypothetical protein